MGASKKVFSSSFLKYLFRSDYRPVRGSLPDKIFIQGASTIITNYLSFSMFLSRVAAFAETVRSTDGKEIKLLKWYFFKD